MIVVGAGARLGRGAPRRGRVLTSVLDVGRRAARRAPRRPPRPSACARGRGCATGRPPRAGAGRWSAAPARRAASVPASAAIARTSRSTARAANRCRKPRAGRTRPRVAQPDPAREAQRGRRSGASISVGEVEGQLDRGAREVEVRALRGPAARRVEVTARTLPNASRAQAPMAWKPPSTCTISPVVAGKKSDSSAHDGLRGRARGPSRPSPAARGRSTSTRAPRSPGSPWRPGSCSGPADDQVDPDALRAEVAGEVARAGLQAGLGHAHPVVRRPGDGRVEGQPDDRAARAPSAAGRPRPATSGSTPRPARPARRPPTGRRGTCRRAASRGCRRRSSAPRRRARRRARAPGRRRPLEVLGVGDVELEHRAARGSRLAIRLVMPSARPKLEISTVAPCSWATVATANPIELSIVTPATRIRLPSRMPMPSYSSVGVGCVEVVGQWPMPRPPSTGMTAPVT